MKPWRAALALSFCVIVSDAQGADTLHPITGSNPAAKSFGPESADTIRTVQASDPGPLCPGLQFKWRATPPTIEPFEIPRGQVYAVTGIDWTVDSAPPLGNVTANIFVGVGVNGTFGVNGPVGQSTALADANGHAGTSIAFPTPVVVGSEEALCIEAQPLGDPPITLAVAHGFLAAAR